MRLRGCTLRLSMSRLDCPWAPASRPLGLFKAAPDTERFISCWPQEACEGTRQGCGRRHTAACGTPREGGGFPARTGCREGPLLHAGRGFLTARTSSKSLLSHAPQHHSDTASHEHETSSQNSLQFKGTCFLQIPRRR